MFIEENAFENVVCEMASILSRPQCNNCPSISSKKCSGMIIRDESQLQFLQLECTLSLDCDKLELVERPKCLG